MSDELRAAQMKRKPYSPSAFRLKCKALSRSYEKAYLSKTVSSAESEFVHADAHFRDLDYMFRLFEYKLEKARKHIREEMR